MPDNNESQYVCVVKDGNSQVLGVGSQKWAVDAAIRYVSQGGTRPLRRTREGYMDHLTDSFYTQVRTADSDPGAHIADINTHWLHK